MLEEMANARSKELRAHARQISHRMEHEQFLRIERLERALARARGRLSLLRTSSAQAK